MVTLLFAAFTLLSSAVTVTVPVLVVSPAAMVSVVPFCVKSPATAGLTGVADIVMVVSALDARFIVAVTVVELSAPLSSMVEGVRTSVTVGVDSSSSMVSVTSAGSVTPLELVATPDTVTVLAFASTLLSLVVMVTVPVLDVSPAAMVRVVLALRPKSSAAAPVSGVAETVTVVTSLDARSMVAVTVVKLLAPLS